MKKILIVGFKPFGIIGNILKINPSEELARLFAEIYNLDLIILPVNNSCINLINKKIDYIKPDKIICFGQGSNLRIESECYDKKVKLSSNFANHIKKIVKMKKNDIGDYYCNDIYVQCLKRVKKSIFIHVNFMYNSREINKLIGIILNA